MKSVKNIFDLTGRVAIITGGAGLLGKKHAEAIAEMGGKTALWDLDVDKAEECAAGISQTFGVKSIGLKCDVTSEKDILEALSGTNEAVGPVDILINNAARNPKVEARDGMLEWSRFENFPLEAWRGDIEVGLTGSFLCSQLIGTQMASRGRGVILNIASDLAVIAPDQRLYRQPGLAEEQQPVKPVSYSVVKSGLIGLTRYLATYWAHKGIRVNSISPGGVYANQDEDFVDRISRLIPLGRMAQEDEYKAAVLFLVSDASSYMTGSNVVIDGGRTCW